MLSVVVMQSVEGTFCRGKLEHQTLMETVLTVVFVTVVDSVRGQTLKTTPPCVKIKLLNTVKKI